MDDIGSLLDKAVNEIERMLNTKTVVGEPITIEGNTLIPLVNVGFGFGVGTGQGSEAQKGTGPERAFSGNGRSAEVGHEADTRGAAQQRQ